MDGSFVVTDDYDFYERWYNLQNIKQVYRDGEKLYIELKDGKKEILYEGEDAKIYLNGIRKMVYGFKRETVPTLPPEANFMDDLKVMLEKCKLRQKTDLSSIQPILLESKLEKVSEEQTVF